MPGDSSQRVQALRGLDLEITKPGFYAIMGASGSGKSTLLHLLASLDRPDSGEVHLSGRALHTLGDREATAFRRREIGVVFQQFNLIPTLNARQNIELPGLLAGEAASWLVKRSSELLDRLALLARADHRPDMLSGGEQQRVAIARALLFSPKVILADEPTGNLDSANSAKLWGLLRDLSLTQVTGVATSVLMVTHEPAAASFCRRAFVLKDGVMLGEIETEGLDAGGVATRYQQLVGR
jgi:putative ABC transport system ATP-binding protein